MIIFSRQELQCITENWPYLLQEEVASLFNDKFTSIQIDRKARSMGLKKVEDIRWVIKRRNSDKMVYRNKNILGRNLDKDTLSKIASQYMTKSEFRKADESAYASARINKWLDEITSHMIKISSNFIYPQAFLYNIIRKEYNTYNVTYNDRKAIYPKELDIFIPELKLAIEYDSRHFHNRKHDKEKNLLCKEKGITLIRIIEVSKRYPEYYIIDALKKFSIIKNTPDVNDIISLTNDFRRSLVDPLVYKDIGDLKVRNKQLYIKIKNNNMLKNYFEDDRKLPWTIADILKGMNSCTYKEEFYMGMKGLYLAYKRRYRNNKLLNEAYNKLLNKNDI